MCLLYVSGNESIGDRAEESRQRWPSGSQSVREPAMLLAALIQKFYDNNNLTVKVWIWQGSHDKKEWGLIFWNFIIKGLIFGWMRPTQLLGGQSCMCLCVCEWHQCRKKHTAGTHYQQLPHTLFFLHTIYQIFAATITCKSWHRCQPT